MNFFGNLSVQDEGNSPESFDTGGLPTYRYKDLTEKEEIGKGGFATVFTAKIQGAGKEKIVVKKVLRADACARRSVVKEARLLASLRHVNVVLFKGVCLDECALLLEHVNFDFRPIGGNMQVTNLADFLWVCEQSHCQGMSAAIFVNAALDVASGLEYLHSRDVTHRDLKPANVLVSNHHYQALKDVKKIETMVSIKPLVCKLADFGESRSRDICTQQIIMSKTKRVDRGTIGFMAPELMVRALQLNEASLDDMKRADVWGYGMVVFSLINPGLEHPYQINSELHAPVASLLHLFDELLSKKEHPFLQEKYSTRHQEEWSGLKLVYESCTKFSPSARPPMKNVLRMVDMENRLLTPEEDNLEFHLKVSQSTSVENVDHEVQLAHQTGVGPHVSYEAGIPDDATNACAFLTLMIAHQLYEMEEAVSWNYLGRIAEVTIVTFPHVLNTLRDITKMYDVMEAYAMLKENNCLPSCYYLTEELPCNDDVHSDVGKKRLYDGIIKVASEQPMFGFFTCGSSIFLVGSHQSSNMFVLDTHSVPPSAGGRFTSMLKRFVGSAEDAASDLCNWLRKRVGDSDLHRPQSLCLLIKEQKKDVNNANWEQQDLKMTVQSPTTTTSQSTGTLTETGQAVEATEPGEKQEGPVVSKPSTEWLNSDNDEEAICSLYEPPHYSDDEESSITTDCGKGSDTNCAEQNMQEAAKQNAPSGKRTFCEAITISSDDNSDNERTGQIPKWPSMLLRESSDESEDEDERETNENRAVQYYNDDPTTPVYEWTTEVKSPQEVLPVLLMPPNMARTCTRIPTSISDDVCFLLDISKLECSRDWKCDDMGSWRNNGVQHYVLPTPLNAESFHDVDVSEHDMKRIYFKHKSSPDLRKYATYLEEYPSLVFIQYQFDGEPHAVNPGVHGNSRKPSAQEYIRTKESTKMRLQEAVTTEKPKSAYHKVLGEKGGIRSANSPSDLPRNRDQAKYVKRTKNCSVNKVDSLVILLTQCKREQLQHAENSFIKEVTGAPELRCVLGYNWQMDELATFCTDPESFSVLGVDPTFNLGRFNVTVTTFRNRKIVHKAGGHHPIMIGPLLLSQTKSFDAYNYFFSKLVGLNKEARNILAYGTDGEEELYKALKFNFPYAVHLRCFMHFRENCKTQLRQSNVPEMVQKEILADIFGRRVGDTWENGLVDAKDEDALRCKLALCEESWNTKERDNLPQGQVPTFHRYILERIDVINECMSRTARSRAGLGDPPLAYYTNDSESANAMIKRAVDFKEKEISEFVSKMGVLMQQQKEDVESAILNKGPYTLAKKFKHFYVSEGDWFKKRNEQRERHMDRFHKAKMGKENDCKTTGLASEPGESQISLQSSLSVDLLTAGIGSLPAETLRAIVNKSEELLSRDGAITPAPGNNNAFMVESQTRPKPHFVQMNKNGKVTCDGCPSFASAKLCSHTIAVAQKAGKLKCFLQWLKTKGPMTMNLTALVTFDSNKNTGRKASQSSTSKRKGGRSKRDHPVTHVTDRQFSGAAPTPNTGPVVSATERQPSMSTYHTPQPPIQAPTTPRHTTHAQSNMQGIISQPTQSPAMRLQSNVGCPTQQLMDPHPTPPACQTRMECPLAPSTQPPIQLQGGAYFPPGSYNASPLWRPPSSQPPQPPGVQPYAQFPVSQVPVLPRRSTPKPAPGTFELHFLSMCPAQTRVCFGCSRTLKPGDSIPAPPHDLAVVSFMFREFFLPTTGELVDREGNVYFHLNLKCVRLKQPGFQPVMLKIATSVASRLTEGHVALLRQLGFQI